MADIAAGSKEATGNTFDEAVTHALEQVETLESNKRYQIEVSVDRKTNMVTVVLIPTDS